MRRLTTMPTLGVAMFVVAGPLSAAAPDFDVPSYHFWNVYGFYGYFLAQTKPGIAFWSVSGPAGSWSGSGSVEWQSSWSDLLLPVRADISGFQPFELGPGAYQYQIAFDEQELVDPVNPPRTGILADETIVTPEPATLGLIGLGLGAIGLGRLVRRRR